MRRGASRVVATLLLAFVTSWLPPANATTIYWDGSGTGWNSTGSWSTNSGATTPDPAAVPGIGDDVVFNITTVNTAQTVSLNANQAANSLLFRSTGTELLQGGGTNRTLTLGVGGVTINSGAGAVTLGSGTAGQNVSVLLNGNETWTNNSSNVFTIQNGVSNVGNVTPFTLTVDGTGNTTFNGIISNGGATGTVALTKNGTRTATLAAANTYTGATTINGGTLTGASGNTWNNNISSSSALALGGGTLSLNFANKGNQTFNGMTVNSGASTIATTNGSGGGGNAYALSLGAITRNVGGTLNFDETGTNGANGSIATTATNTNGILGGYATVNGTTWATISGGNIIGLASGSYSTNGFAANANTDITSNQSPAANININSLRFNTASAVTLTLSGTNIIQSGGILETTNVGNNASVITGGTLEGASGKDLVVIQNNTSNSLRISSIIADNTGATALTKSGAGTLILDGANTYTGVTYIHAGTLSANAAGALGSGTTGTTQINVNNSGTVLLNGSSAVTDRINNNANIRLNGGTFNSNGFTELAMGALTLQSNSILDVATIQSGLTNDILKFANSSGQAATWSTNMLSIYNWTGNFAVGGGTDQIFVGTDTTGLTAQQLLDISFYSDAGTTFLGHAGILANGEIVPIPEPSTWLAAVLALGAIGFSQRKRLRIIRGQKAFLTFNS